MDREVWEVSQRRRVWGTDGGTVVQTHQSHGPTLVPPRVSCRDVGSFGLASTSRQTFEEFLTNVWVSFKVNG